MSYVRKTRNVWCIDTNWGSGWETESEYRDNDYEGRPEYADYNPRKACKADAKGYLKAGAQVRIVKRRERIEK